MCTDSFVTQKPWASYPIRQLRVAHAPGMPGMPGMPGTFYPLFSDRGMHHASRTCRGANPQFYLSGKRPMASGFMLFNIAFEIWSAANAKCWINFSFIFFWLFADSRLRSLRWIFASDTTMPNIQTVYRLKWNEYWLMQRKSHTYLRHENLCNDIFNTCIHKSIRC